jgi:hypothetical protein
VSPKHQAALTSLWLLVAVPMLTAQQTPPPLPVSPAAEQIEPDRPDVTNGTHIVDIGLLQLEFGAMYTRTDTVQRSFGSPVTARIGLFEWLEARVGTDGVLTRTDGIGREIGVGNLQLGAKLRLWADPGGVPVLSILPGVSVPTASAAKGLGSGDSDYTLALLTGTDVGRRAHVDLNYGIGAIGAGQGRPHFAQHLVSISGSFVASARWNPYAEAFWFSRQNVDDGSMAAIDTGAIFVVSPRLAVDGGVQWGVSRAAPGLACFAGISVVVGDILGNHGVHARQRAAERRAPSPAPHR